MKTAIILILALISSMPAWACEVCEKNQPKLLKGITHGTGPQSGWDMPIIYVSAVIVLVTLVFSVKYLVKPGEDSEDHIKRAILHNSPFDHAS